MIQTAALTSRRGRGRLAPRGKNDRSGSLKSDESTSNRFQSLAQRKRRPILSGPVEVRVLLFKLIPTWETRSLSLHDNYIKIADYQNQDEVIHVILLEDVLHCEVSGTKEAHSVRLRDDWMAALTVALTDSTVRASAAVAANATRIGISLTDNSHQRSGNFDGTGAGTGSGCTNNEDAGICSVPVRAIAKIVNAEVRGLVDTAHDAELLVELDKLRAERRRGWGIVHQLRGCCRWLYSRSDFQLISSFLVLLNFALYIVECQVQPEPNGPFEKILACFDFAFLALFSLELAINLIGNLGWKFFSNPWNWFDVFIFVTSTIYIAMIQAGNTLFFCKLIRAIRIGRVVHLVKYQPTQHWQPLRRIIAALSTAMPAMIHSFILVCLFMALWAILANNLFGDTRPDLFGNFERSIFTMFQVMTGDGWSDIVRSLVDGLESGTRFGIILFFVIFVLTAGVILMNLAVAVLIDEFGRERQAAEEIFGRAFELKLSVFQPMLEILRNFEDLPVQLCSVYQEVLQAVDNISSEPKVLSMASKLRSCRWDWGHGHREAGVGRELTLKELSMGLRKLELISDELDKEWEAEARSRGLLGASKMVDFERFKAIVLDELRQSQVRQINAALDASLDASGRDFFVALLGSVKLLLAPTEGARVSKLVGADERLEKLEQAMARLEAVLERNYSATDQRLATLVSKLSPPFHSVAPFHGVARRTARSFVASRSPAASQISSGGFFLRSPSLTPPLAAVEPSPLPLVSAYSAVSPLLISRDTSCGRSVPALPAVAVAAGDEENVLDAAAAPPSLQTHGAEDETAQLEVDLAKGLRVSPAAISDTVVLPSGGPLLARHLSSLPTPAASAPSSRILPITASARPLRALNRQGADWAWPGGRDTLRESGENGSTWTGLAALAASLGSLSLPPNLGEGCPEDERGGWASTLLPRTPAKA